MSDFRNAPLIALELLSEGREVSKEFIEIAKRDLDRMVPLLVSVDNHKI
jgi:hypothetical protein